MDNNVSIERLDLPVVDAMTNHPALGSEGGKFALQVDGYDVAICEVGATRMRTTIYDQDPRQSFVAHESVSSLSNSDVGTQRPTAAQRLAKLCERRTGDKPRGLER